MGDMTKDFSRWEFACPCCGKDDISAELVVVLQAVRDEINSPVEISSGVRCEKHNKEVGGSELSAHLDGDAADIVCSVSRLRYAIVASAIRAGIVRVGVAGKFIHIDRGVKSGLAQMVMWVY